MLQTRSRWGRQLVAAAIILVAVTMASSRLFAATSGGEEETGPGKDETCKLLGCTKGPQACADAKVLLEFTGLGKIEVTWHCYQEPGTPDDLVI